jgi:hypothetical protein
LVVLLLAPAWEMVGKARSCAIPDVAEQGAQADNNPDNNGQRNSTLHHIPKQIAIFKACAVATLVAVLVAAHDLSFR